MDVAPPQPPLIFMECGGRGCAATGDTALGVRHRTQPTLPNSKDRALFLKTSYFRFKFESINPLSQCTHFSQSPPVLAGNFSIIARFRFLS
jgi:hypothetical protein